MPTVRKSVLLPDMFEPLTIRTWVGCPSARSFRTDAESAISGWPSRFGLRMRRAGSQLREGVVLVFRGIGAEGAQGLELADRTNPPRDLRAGLSSPGVDPDCQQRRPVPKRRKRGEELVAPCVEQVE